MGFLGGLLMVFGVISLILNPILGVILIIGGCMCFMARDKSETKKITREQIKKQEETIVSKEQKDNQKKIWIAKRTKEIMEKKNNSITEAKEEAELEYVLEFEAN